ncbi:hypothetical protein MZM54_02425 [[Brevibacterium] frigoritolerans]|nr:hypothetical protein [Peribacillus frigoritolerans]
MATKHQRKVEKAFLEINEWFNKWNKNIVDPSVAEKEVRLLVEKIKNYEIVIDKNEKYFKKEYEEKLNDVKEKFILNSECIFEEYRINYPINLTYKDFIDGNETKLLNLGVSGLLKREKILETIYHKAFEELLPLHPKDEHPLARAIKRKFTIHTGPTNSGKTFESLIKLKESKNGLYLAPLRLLAVEVFEKLNMDGTPCTLKTGEEEIEVPFSYHISSTIEKADLETFYDLVVIDEAQMSSDPSRGNAWTRAILGIVSTDIHICCSLNAVPIIKKLIDDCDDEVEVIVHERKTPLIVEKDTFTFPKDIQSGDAFIVFSRKMVLQVASVLSDLGIKSSLIYGNLPPETRRRQVQLFIDGETDVVISTDAIGMGLNLPIRRVVFLNAEKFDGYETRCLTDQEVKQIAGRAGRQGLYPKGFVNIIDDKDRILKQLCKKDDDITQIYIAPLEQTILSLNIGTLKEKLENWSSFKSKVPYIEKADIIGKLQLLDHIPDKLYQLLSEEQIYRAIHIPFDYEDEELLLLWDEYLEQTVLKVKEYKKPAIHLVRNLSDVETMYREVDLYYSFSKSFNKTLDQDWVREHRERLSLEIHEKLKNQMMNFRNRCRKCVTALECRCIYDECEM